MTLGAGQFTWFENRGIGRPVPDSLRASLDWFTEWVTRVAPPSRPVVLVGFSGGAAFAGAAVLDEPTRYAGAALLHGTVPFEAGLATTPGRLEGARVFHTQGRADVVMPADLMARTWRFLTEESGGSVTAMMVEGSHEITAETVSLLRAWLLSTRRADA